MELIVGLLTILLIVTILRLCGVKEDIGCLTFLIIVFGLPLIASVGKSVLSLL